MVLGFPPFRELLEIVHSGYPCESLWQGGSQRYALVHTAKGELP